MNTPEDLNRRTLTESPRFFYGFSMFFYGFSQFYSIFFVFLRGLSRIFYGFHGSPTTKTHSFVSRSLSKRSIKPHPRGEPGVVEGLERHGALLVRGGHQGAGQGRSGVGRGVGKWSFCGEGPVS